MSFALEDRWIWDSWYAHDGERHHGFFLEAPKSIGEPELRHWNTSVHHAVSDDLVRWESLGTCLRPAPGPAWNDWTTWTGSVVRGPDGRWNLFYTASCHAEDGKYQRIGRAVSDDLHSWERVGDGPCLDLTPAFGDAWERYEADWAHGLWHDRALRDPWVMRDPEGEGWLMFLTARAAGVAEPNDGGAIALATSPDLGRWTLEPPVHVGGFGQLEVPQVFELDGRWYCLFCTAAQHYAAATAKEAAERGEGPVTGTHYLVGEGPRGPWRLGPLPFLDGALPPRRYAARMVPTADGPRWLGFVDRPEGHAFHGTLSDPDRLRAGPDGRLILEEA
jgi:beta-fructofuranosidase